MSQHKTIPAQCASTPCWFSHWAVLGDENVGPAPHPDVVAEPAKFKAHMRSLLTARFAPPHQNGQYLSVLKRTNPRGLEECALARSEAGPWCEDLNGVETQRKPLRLAVAVCLVGLSRQCRHSPSRAVEESHGGSTPLSRF